MDSGRLEVVPNGAVHLDTVRALHQTVVSLRTALEISKNELRELKEKYEQHSHCLEYADVIEKLTLENHVLRRRIIDSDFEEKGSGTQNIKLEVTYSPRSRNTDYPDSEVVIQTATDVYSAKETDSWQRPNVSDKEASELVQESETFSPKDNLEPSQARSPRDNSELSQARSPRDNSEFWQQGYSPKDTLQPKQRSDENSNFCSTDKLNEIPEISESPELNVSAEFSTIDSPKNTEQEQSQIVSLSKKDSNFPSFKTHLELLSKFDVRIKVRTLKDGAVTSSGTSDSDSTFDEKRDKKTNLERTFEFEERREHFDNKEDYKGNKVNLKSVATEAVKMAVPNEGDVKSKTDKFDVQVRITSEENLVVKENVERSRRKDTFNLDVDDLSLRSLSEGDNSVFSEGATPAEPPAEDKQDLEASGNESEEVDDIELIFTTDESKDMSMNLQEDLVSIRESENWAPNSASTTHSTPVLIKFHTLDPDFQPGSETDAPDENQDKSEISESALKMKRVSLPNDKEIRHVAFNGKGSLDLPGRGILKSCDNKSDITLYKKSPNTSTRRLDSVDSLTCEYNRGLSFDNTKSSSFELGSSMDILHRDESVDSFHRTGLGHRFSVFAERDISKCGTSEDDLAANLNVRRNTCPNPFQYRAPPYRGVSRPPGPFKAPLSSSRVRPVLRDPAHPRREHAVQTDVSALPNRWSSDGYLAHKLPVPATHVVPTLPTRAAVSRRAPAREPRAPPPRRTDETRRVLLSDIGFTSMVPELSRSADPVWALARKHHDEEPLTTNTAKFLSRGASYRSPSLSTDHSSDWTPHYGYVPAHRLDYRPWRSSLPDVRHDDTEELLEEAETFLRRSIPDLPGDGFCDGERLAVSAGQPYIPAGPRQLRLGHAVKVITPYGRIAIGRVRYVGIAGGTAASSSVMVGVEFSTQQYPTLPRNDGTHRGRRYFLTPPHYTALFVPFSKVVMAWAH